MIRVFLNAKEEKEIQQGFPWVFDNEIAFLKYQNADGKWQNGTLKEAPVVNGSLCEVCTKAGGFLGTGVINRNSKITVRIISRGKAEPIEADRASFIDKKIANCVNIRKLNYKENDSYRLIFGEAEFIPGLICEKYVEEKGDIYLVIQFLSMSCDIFRDEILSSLKKHVKPDFIYERSDSNRIKEGLEEKNGWIGKAGKEQIIILENDVRLCVDIANGQKTGYFLDQKFNRKEAAKYCHGKKVLDTFTHTGAFGLNACMAGAKEVTSVDISEEAVSMVNNNIRLNGKEKLMKAICADVFDLLKQYEEQGEKFDVIILDPPAFTKSAKMIEKAYGGYKEINLRAMRLLNDGGILVTCSCSHFFNSNTFYDMLMHAAKDSHKSVQILEKRGAGPDHPVLAGYPKSEYLKCAITRVINN